MMGTVARAANRETLRRYVVLVLASLAIGVLVLLYMSYSHAGRIPSIRYQFDRYLLAILITLTCSFAVFHIDRLLDRFILWRTSFLIRFLSGFILNVSVATSIVAASAVYVFGLGQEDVLKLSILFTISIFVYEIFYGWFYSYRYYAYTQVEGLRSERWQMELQFESLKNQISPHYLFNCLNTISALLYKDSQIAEEFIRRMADTFRYVLSNQKQELVTVRNEIEFVKSYYYLLQVRYEHHLRLEINLPKSVLDSNIPPLTIQILIENAVKHNQISKDSPLLVYISSQDNTHIRVTSTKTTPIHVVDSFKVGLNNIRNRYQFFTPEGIQVKDDEKFTVQLPVIRPAKGERKSKSQGN